MYLLFLAVTILGINLEVVQLIKNVYYCVRIAMHLCTFTNLVGCDLTNGHYSKLNCVFVKNRCVMWLKCSHMGVKLNVCVSCVY